MDTCIESEPNSGAELTADVLRMVGEEVLGLEDLAMDADFFENGLDSMAIMQTLLLLEENFGVQIPVESISRENFANARAIAALLMERGWQLSESKASPVAPPPSHSLRTATSEELLEGTFERLPLRESDHFPLAFDHSLRGDGLAGHVAHTFVELEGVPEVRRLQDVIADLPDIFPILTARIRKRGFGLPCWEPAAEAPRLELQMASQTGGPGKLLQEGASPFDDLGALLATIINATLRRDREAWENARFHLIEKRGGDFLMVCSWSHLAMDGVGAELFLTEVGRLLRGETRELPVFDHSPVDRRGWYERWKAAQPMIGRLVAFRQQGFDCLPPRKLKQGALSFEVFTLTKEQTAEAARRSASICGPLVQMPFHLACAMRAHAAAFAAQGRDLKNLMSNVPVQTRPKGSAGPVFQNHLTMFFGSLTGAEMVSWESATRRLFEQHSTFVKDKLGEGFRDMMWMMRHMPPALHMRFVKWQMKGLFCSFFHSHTGGFAPGLPDFAGATVTNGWHVPGLASPPGTGIFGSEREGRLTLTFCENCGALGERERRAMLERLFDDYCGSPLPEPELRSD